MFKVKITLDQINYGPNRPELDDLEVMVWAHDLQKKGYRRVSNAYCEVARIDRDDWLDVLASKMNCSRADFYNVNGSGVMDKWRDQYVRYYSKDKLTVHPQILRKIPSY